MRLAKFVEKQIKSIVVKVDPVVDSTLKFAQGISEFGIFVVIASLMLVVFVCMLVFIFKLLRKNNEKMLESQTRTEKQNEKIISLTEVTIGLLNKIAESESEKALTEQSKYNTERLLSVSFLRNSKDILSGVKDILSYNHISDKDFTYNRISNVVSSAHFERIKWLNNFKYKGTRIGELADSESWIDEKIKVVDSYIYSDNHNPDTLARELEMLYKKFSNQLKL